MATKTTVKTTGTTTTQPSSELSPAELFALCRAGKPAEKVRDHLQDGTAPEVDVTVRLKGMLQIGLAGICERTVKPELVNLLGLVLEILTAAQRRTLEKRLDLIFGHFAGGPEWPEAEPERRILAETLIERWSKREERTQRGAVTGVIVAEVLYRGEWPS